MYINPFLAGVLATIFAEMIIIIIAAIGNVIKNSNYNEEDK
jgi:hypothetical protein